MSDVTDTPEYKLGWEWAVEHAPQLAELYTGKELITQELRSRLFRDAMRRWPSQPGDMENELKQTAFVAGAFKAFSDELPLTPEAVAAVFEAALEMGVIYSVEQAKKRYLAILKEKPVGWWRKKLGDASPNEVVGALAHDWRVRIAPERKRKDPKNKWEVIIDTMGSREMDVLATVTHIVYREDGDYKSYVVESDDGSFQLLARPVFSGMRMTHAAGEIVG